MIFKCLWLHFPFFSSFLYSQTLKADEVTVGSILLITALPVLLWVTPPRLQLAEQLSSPPNNSSFPLGRHFWLSVLCKWGERALLWSHIVLPGARAAGKQSDAEDQGSSVSSLTSSLGWVMGTHPVSLSSAQSMPDIENTDITRHNKAREEKNYNTDKK